MGGGMNQGVTKNLPLAIINQQVSLRGLTANSDV